MIDGFLHRGLRTRYESLFTGVAGVRIIRSTPVMEPNVNRLFCKGRVCSSPMPRGSEVDPKIDDSGSQLFGRMGSRDPMTVPRPSIGRLTVGGDQ